MKSEAGPPAYVEDGVELEVVDVLQEGGVVEEAPLIILTNELATQACRRLLRHDPCVHHHQLHSLISAAAALHFFNELHLLTVNQLHS